MGGVAAVTSGKVIIDKLYHNSNEIIIRDLTPHAKKFFVDAYDECSIMNVNCEEDLNVHNVAVTKCGHAFCSPCLTQWLAINNSCPACRYQG
jgi:hypothetical protein